MPFAPDADAALNDLAEAMSGQINPFAILRLLVYFALLIGCMYTDLISGKVYNSITLSAVGLALLIRVFEGNFQQGLAEGLQPLRLGVSGAILWFIVFFFVWAIGALSGKPLMGGGDVKLMGAIGALSNAVFGWYVAIYSFTIAAVMALWVLFRHGELWAGLVGSFRRAVWPSHPSEVSRVEQRATGRTISFCTAICIGGMLAFWWHRFDFFAVN
jgi:Flp pilus assembly protein protease CpaA